MPIFLSYFTAWLVNDDTTFYCNGLFYGLPCWLLKCFQPIVKRKYSGNAKDCPSPSSHHIPSPNCMNILAALKDVMLIPSPPPIDWQGLQLATCGAVLALWAEPFLWRILTYPHIRGPSWRCWNGRVQSLARHLVYAPESVGLFACVLKWSRRQARRSGCFPDSWSLGMRRWQTALLCWRWWSTKGTYKEDLGQVL